MKKVLMIHEVCEDLLSLPGLDDFILTFDDGLYSQFKYFESIIKIPTSKYFFISTNIVAKENEEQNPEYIKCSDAHEMYFTTGTREHYMNWEQIKHIYNSQDCYIGGHSHDHIRNCENIFTDTNLMLSKFILHNITIDSFCFPYNMELKYYKELLMTKNIRSFFGPERVDVNDL